MQPESNVFYLKFYTMDDIQDPRRILYWTMPSPGGLSPNLFNQNLNILVFANNLQTNTLHPRGPATNPVFEQ
jgi:hypothetical protein